MHDGLDAVICFEGEVVLEIEGMDYRLPAGECAVYTAGAKHRLRSEGKKNATVVGVTTT